MEARQVVGSGETSQTTAEDGDILGSIDRSSGLGGEPAPLLFGQPWAWLWSCEAPASQETARKHHGACVKKLRRVSPG